MTKKSLLPFALAALVVAGWPLQGMAADEQGAAVESSEPQPEEGGMAAPPEEDGEPYPPDGVTDPDIAYPTEGTDEDPQGELAAPESDAPAPDSQD